MNQPFNFFDQWNQQFGNKFQSIDDMAEQLAKKANPNGIDQVLMQGMQPNQDAPLPPPPQMAPPPAPVPEMVTPNIPIPEGAPPMQMPPNMNFGAMMQGMNLLQRAQGQAPQLPLARFIPGRGYVNG